jgi:steroid delta-isomerase-like uncharacterized protein
VGTDDNKALVRRYIEAVWHEGLPAAEFFAPDYRRHLSPLLPPLGPSEQAARIAGFRAAFPDIRFTIEHLLAEDDRVIFRCTVRGTQRGSFAGLPASGKSMTIGLLDAVRIAAGRIAEHWGGPDMADLRRQLEPPACGAA